MNTPTWALAVAYWLHMLATVVWIGGLATLALLVLPAAQRALDAKAQADLLEHLQRRLDPLGWFCLALLAGTGMLQMSANPNYAGFLAIHNPWAVAILLKHGLFAVMIAVSGYLTWGLLPRLRRVALLQAKGKNTPDADHLRRQNILLLRVELILAVVVLALTSFARSV